MSCTLTLFSITLGYLAIKEVDILSSLLAVPLTDFAGQTLPSKIREKQRLLAHATPAPAYGAVASEPAGADVPEAPANPPPSIRSLIVDPVVFSVVRTYFMLSLNGTAFDVLFVLLSYTAVVHGGLSRNVRIAFCVSASDSNG